MNMPIARWRSYEEVARYLLNEIAAEFCLESVEGKQKIQGQSGTWWEIDAKGCKEGNEGFVIVECRRYLQSRLPQKDLGAVAYCILDTKAEGGIVVSPLPFQMGAQKVAQHNNILHVTLTPESTTQDYMLSFLNKIFLGFSSLVSVSDSYSIEVVKGQDS